MAKKPAQEAPAPEGEEGAAEGEAPAKKKPPMMMIIIAAAAAVILIGGGVTTFLLLKPKPDAHAEKGHEKPKKKAKKGRGAATARKPRAALRRPARRSSRSPDGVVFYTLPDIVVTCRPPTAARPS